MSELEPTFKSIFDKDWDNLPTVLKRHYQNRPYSKDITTVKGKLDVACSGPMLWFAPVFKLLGGVPPANEKQVPVTVNFISSPHDKSFSFVRYFNFSNYKPYTFKSSMKQVRGNEVVEIMRLGLCWRMNCLWQNNTVILKHKGYALKVFNLFIPLPISLIIGRVHAEEKAVDENSFDMFVNINHPIWGDIYSYKGRFHFIDGEK